MPSPRVLVDGYNLAMKQGTGIKTYTGLLASALTEHGADVSYLFGHPIPETDDPLLREVLFFDDNPLRNNTPVSALMRRIELWVRALVNNSPKVTRVPDNGVVVAPEGGRSSDKALNAPKLFDIAWRRSVSFGKFLDVEVSEAFDAVHMTYPLPVRVRGPAKKIVTIHDLIPLRLPYTTLDDKSEMLRRHRVAAEEADLIFTVSDFSKSDIVKLLDVDPDKIQVTHQPSRFEPLRGPEIRERDKILRRMELEPGKYFLFVGAIEPKKNLGRLLKAFVEANVSAPIAVVGPRGWLWADEIGWLLESQDPAIRAKVKFLNHVSVPDLRFLYSGAIALTFPSLYEGYGLPLVEAMRFGIPLLTSRTSSLPEVAGDAALLVDPLDVRDIREKIERLYNDIPLRQYLSDMAVQRSSQLSPYAFGEQVAAGYRKIGLL
jgi:glycosyltransferase involved in cell wall biosynthesis